MKHISPAVINKATESSSDQALDTALHFFPVKAFLDFLDFLDFLKHFFPSIITAQL